MSKTVFTITWVDGVTDGERLRISRLWAAALSDKRGVAACRMQTFRTYRHGPQDARAGVSLGEGPCSVCGLLAPLVMRGPKDDKRVVLREHYPENHEDAYAPEPGFYCTGSGKPPADREVAA